MIASQRYCLIVAAVLLGVALPPNSGVMLARADDVHDLDEVVVTADGETIPQPSIKEQVVKQQQASSKGKTNAAIDPKCPDRDHLMRCARVHLDTNNNNKLDREELNAAISSLPWYDGG